jgi:hypothetical protein
MDVALLETTRAVWNFSVSNEYQVVVVVEVLN